LLETTLRDKSGGPDRSDICGDRLRDNDVMPRSRLILVVAAALAAGILPGAINGGQTQTAAAATANCSWMDKQKSANERASELVKAMTLDQKIAELYGRGGTSYGAANDIPAVPALCIPELVYNDAGAGVADGETQTTAFPDPISQAASWDRTLQHQVGRAIGWEAWHKGIDVQLAPGVDIARSPLNGRNFEYDGEDPYLSGQTAVAQVRGIQSRDVVATVKHYALNDQELNRMSDSSDASHRTMEEIHLPAFEAAVRQGHVGSVMCSYNRVNSVYACQNKYLLRNVLKGQFGFSGWVMSDWGATHSTVQAANNGLDQEMFSGTGSYFNGPLKAAVQDHQVSMHRLDDMVLRLMRSLFRIGVFDNPPPSEPDASSTDVHTAAHTAIALQAAEGGAVLLKNDGHALPLPAGNTRIAVIGKAAGPTGAQTYYQGGGSSKVPNSGQNPYIVDPLQGIMTRAASAPGDVVSYTEGDSAAAITAAAKAADVAIVVVGDSASEGQDRTSLTMSNRTCDLFGCQDSTGPTPDQTIATAAAANPNTIVVLQTGYPVVMPWLGQVKAVLESWYPGEQEGNAIAALLFGDVNPSGKLPYTFPTSQARSPIHTKAQYPGVSRNGSFPHSVYSEHLLVGYRWYDAKNVSPLFPFGFGLSYTSFRYSGIHVRATATGATVSFRLTNTGKRAGADVAQLYVSDPPAAKEPPKQLKGYAKVLLDPGESKRVTLTLDKRSFAYWNVPDQGWRVAPGCYGIRVGGSSASLPLRANVARGGDHCA
jgi:beta-glucosidase